MCAYRFTQLEGSFRLYNFKIIFAAICEHGLTALRGVTSSEHTDKPIVAHIRNSVKLHVWHICNLNRGQKPDILKEGSRQFR